LQAYLWFSSTLPQLKLEFLKSTLSAQKKNITQTKDFFASLMFDFSRVQLKFAFRILPSRVAKKDISFIFYLFWKIQSSYRKDFLFWRSKKKSSR